MKKLYVGLGAILVGVIGVTVLTVTKERSVKVNASELDDSTKAKLTEKYGHDWDDVLELAYGDDWEEALKVKFNESINAIVPDEVRRLIVLDQLEDTLENELDLKYGDDWDDLLEAVHGDDWDNKLESMYGKDYVLNLEAELNKIVTDNPGLLEKVQQDDLDDDHDDLYDINDDFDDDHDDLYDINDDIDSKLDRLYGDDWMMH